MATIKAVSPAANNGKFAVAPIPLTGADTLVYSSAKNQTLYLVNTTASAVTVVIDGNAGTTVSPPGLGGTVDVSAGYSVAVAAGAVQAVQLSSIKSFLQGTVNVTGGVAGLLAWIAES